MGASFVGRAQEIARLEELLERGERVVTIVGPPGVGKTRLARQVTESRRAAWVDLSAADDEGALAAALAAALGAAPSGRPAAVDPLVLAAQALAAHGEVLVVLDELERLARFAPATVGRWRDLAPAARFLVTSRERLGLSEEVVLELGPLPVPDRDGDLEADATLLLCDRVRRVRGRFEPSADDAIALSRIARRLEGLPLALELAAARLDVLDPSALLERLADPFGILRGPAHLELSLDRAIACSWDLLDDAERLALAACTVFKGGFEIEAAEAVLADPALGSRTPLDALQSLRNKSLLTAVDSASGRRLGLYAAIRDWASRHLGAREADMRARHLAHYAALARTRADGPKAARLGLEQENLLAALQYGLETGAAEALDVAVALEELPVLRLPLVPHLAWIHRAVEAAAPDDPRLAPLLSTRGRLLRRAGRYKEAIADLERSVALSPDPATEGRTRSVLGRAILLDGRIDDAEQALERALALHRSAGDWRAASWTLSALGYVALQRGDAASARRLIAEALEQATAGGDRQGEALCLYSMALVHHHTGALDAARAMYARAQEVADGTGDTWMSAFCRIEIGLVLLEEGRLAEARTVLEDAEPMIAGFDPRGEGLLSSHLGAVRALEGDLDEARRRLDAAERILQGSDTLLLSAVLGPQRGLLDLAEASRARSAGDREGAELLERRAAERLARARAEVVPSHGDSTREPREGAPSPAQFNTDLVVATRILESALRDRGLGAEPPSAPDGLVVDPDGRWFEAPGQPRASCERRQPLRRILVALVEARLTTPGGTLDRAAIQAAGWPGLKLRADAARNRVNVALYELRKMGLAGVLQSSEDGWHLDPDVPARWGR